MRSRSGTVLAQAARNIVVFALLLAAWELISRSGWVNPFLFPAPSTIATDTLVAFSDPPYIGGEGLWFQIAKSVYRAVAGWLLGVVTGIVFAMVVEWWRLTGDLASALLEFARPIPVILALPILVVIFGLGDTARIIIIAWACFIFVAINAMYGVRTARGALLPDVVRSFGGSDVDVMRKSVLGLARPQIVAGMRQAVGIALVLMVASELILTVNGLGWFILYTRRSLYPSLMYGGILMVGVLGLFFGAAFRRLETYLLRAYPDVH